MKILIIYLSIALFAACSQAQSYKITGHITGVEGMVYLNRFAGEKLIKTDSTESTEGKFTFTGSVNEPEEYYLTFKDKKREFMHFILENSAISIKADLKDFSSTEIEVTGSDSQDILEIYYREIARIEKKQKEMEQTYSHILESFTSTQDSLKLVKMDDEKREEMIQTLGKDADAEIEKVVNEITEEIKQVYERTAVAARNFIKNNNKSYAAVVVVWEQAQNKGVDEIDKLLALLDSSLMETNLVIVMKKRANVLKKISIGRTSPDFTMDDTKGAPVKLSSLFGKGYLLIDFWASWCGPCRAENPYIVAAYKEYHNKGFEILGVSYDDNKEKWLKAIEKDQLPWLHVSELNGWANKTAKLYSISRIPANFLLDKEGRIIAKNLRGEALNKKLAELMD